MRILLVILYSFFAFSVYADQQEGRDDGDDEDNFVSEKQVIINDHLPAKCTATPIIRKLSHYPGRNGVVSSNNLVLPTGKSVAPSGQVVLLSGRLLDKNCVPISDAVVEIWQRDPEGRYITSSLNERSNPYPHFTGSGRSVTDNTGHFSFVTLYPGAFEAAPAINVRISHSNFATVTTKIYFANDRRNPQDKLLGTLKPEQQQMLMGKVEQNDNGEISVQQDIILSGKNAYRKF